MPDNDPASGIRNWEQNFFSLGGLLRKKTPQKSADSSVDTSWHDEMVKAANDSFRKTAQKKVVKKALPAKKAKTKLTPRKRG